jgi:CMP/dCMP kinase
MTFEETFSEMNERDERDSTRVDSPLLVAKDAVVIDSTGLSVAEVFDKMMIVIRKKTEGRDKTA